MGTNSNKTEIDMSIEKTLVKREYLPETRIILIRFYIYIITLIHLIPYWTQQTSHTVCLCFLNQNVLTSKGGITLNSHARKHKRLYFFAGIPPNVIFMSKLELVKENVRTKY